MPKGFALAHASDANDDPLTLAGIPIPFSRDHLLGPGYWYEWIDDAEAVRLAQAIVDDGHAYVLTNASGRLAELGVRFWYRLH